jgi:protein-L-isoaspartate O-methyltransferase
MKKIIYALIASLVRLLSQDSIVKKRFSTYNKDLYYEKAQHLSFLLQKTIQYESLIHNRLKTIVKPGQLVFDIGANIGQYALPLSELVGDTGKVYSFEPDYKNFSFLQFNVHMNRCYNTRCMNYGISKHNSELDY